MIMTNKKESWERNGIVDEMKFVVSAIFFHSEYHRYLQVAKNHMVNRFKGSKQPFLIKIIASGGETVDYFDISRQTDLVIRIIFFKNNEKKREYSSIEYETIKHREVYLNWLKIREKYLSEINKQTN